MPSLARRQVLTSLASLPLATVLADPALAAAVAAELTTVSMARPGGKAVKAALARPAVLPAPCVLLVHEWWGLNDQIKSVAAELAKQGFLALAVDLYDGNVTDQPDQAKAFMQQVVPDEALGTLSAWIDWLKTNDSSTGKVGTVGWCFGGGWSLNASIANPVNATVVYYGRVDQSPDELKALNGPVLGHFATEDQWINKPMVDGFAAAMDSVSKSYEVFWYEANHAFANPTNANYDKGDAKLAWERTLEFFGAQLRA
ncbi:MAG: dienelactone hydrolase family protein [Pseudomonadota bacterium]